MKDPTQVDQIPSGALSSFYAEMRTRSFDKDQYDLFYSEDSDFYYVSTRYKKKPPGLRGSVEGFLDYNVSISRKDFTVKKVVGIR